MEVSCFGDGGWEGDPDDTAPALPAAPKGRARGEEGCTPGVIGVAQTVRSLRCLAEEK